MAQRRMFSLKIVDTDAFLDMPQSSQLLYFHLAMRADDEGFVPNPKKIMRMIGSQEDDYRVLLAKRFILTFESGVCVIKHWLIHNLIRQDRFNSTQWVKEKEQLVIDSKTKKYRLSTGEIDNVIPNGNQMAPQVRLGKVRLDKERVDGDKSPTTPIPSKEDFELSELLLSLIKQNTPTFRQPNIEMWANHIRLLREQDGRTVEQIEFVIKWCQKDIFWQANILSTKKLREKFDTLVAHIKRDVNKENIKKSNVAFS